MFRRYPYWGWLLLSIVLWCINGYNFHAHYRAMQPASLTRTVDRDLHNREEAFDNFTRDTKLLRRIFTDSLTEGESRRVNSLPFYVFGYEGDTLKFWNTNVLVVGYNDSASGKEFILRNEQGVFVEKCFVPPVARDNRKLVVLFPVVYHSTRLKTTIYIPTLLHRNIFR